MNKKFFFIIIIALFTSSCSSYVLQSKLVSETVEKQVNRDSISTFQVDSNYFSDEIISIKWVPTNQGFLFQLENNSDYSIKILWDKAVFVYPDNTCYIVKSKNGNRSETVIVRKCIETDVFIPLNNGSQVNSVGWNVGNILHIEKSTMLSILKDEKERLIGGRYQILLPIEHKNGLTEYIFSFVYDDIKIKKYNFFGELVDVNESVIEKKDLEVKLFYFRK
jgi:hypothetical protein